MIKVTKIKSQRTRFIEAAREAECSDDEAVFDRNLKRVAHTSKSSRGKKPQQRRQPNGK